MGEASTMVVAAKSILVIRQMENSCEFVSRQHHIRPRVPLAWSLLKKVSLRPPTPKFT